MVPTRYQQLKSDPRISDHPCYSKEGHKYARIHLPVAPACNIQCNYCHRKFDCSNESRPGVVSNLLNPLQAAQRVQAVKKRMPELKVVGIAGPGDALANPKQTMATLKAINALEDDYHLCISTNGLELPNQVDQLAALGVHHLTITMNTLDPKIGALLYPWIYFEHQRWYGEEAAAILIEQQLVGLKKAADAGILVKVNTVLVPGINDTGIKALARLIRDKGALLHNIIPLISDPSHGTWFGLNNVKGPNESELKQARQSAGISIDQMTHCQQCRADAIGTLENKGCDSASRNADITPIDDGLGKRTEKHLIAVASSDGQVIDTHFGHAKHFDIYQIRHGEAKKIAQRQIESYCTGPDNCNDETQHGSNDSNHQLSGHIASLHDCTHVLCSRIGLQPLQELVQAGITPVVDFALQPVEAAILELLNRQNYNLADTAKIKEVI